MSQARPPSESPTSDGVPGAPAPPPVAPPAVPPPPASPPAASAPSPTTQRPVPPPPPPRSTLPPVRPIDVPPQTAAATGVGSARGIRWRGELERIGVKAPVSSAESTATETMAADGDDDDEVFNTPSGRVVRSAPPWLVSMVIHLALLLVLALVTTPVGDQLGRIVLSIGQSERENAPELAEFSIDAVDSTVDVDSDIETVSQVELPPVFEAVEPIEINTVTPIDMGNSGGDFAQPTLVMFGGRRGAMKDALLKIYGGTPETQEAVALGLAWLKKQQQRNGKWSLVGPYDDGAFQENECAATAMAMLAFLGDGNTHEEGEYRKVVEKGMKALVKMQDRSGYFARTTRQHHQQMYAQAQATIAICELYGMTKDSWLRPHAQSALDFAAAAQSAQGGWRYAPRQGSDTSVTGWFLMALKSGHNAGLEVDLSKLLKVNDYLDEAQFYDGAAYGYMPRGNPTPAMTAEGLLCREYLGWQRDHPPLRDGLEALLEQSPFDIDQRDVYYWYYATQALHHYGGDAWERWNRVMRVELPEAQTKRGNETGSWAPQQDEYGSSGRLYTTCLSIYCLEVYYRHMPLYEAEASQMHPEGPR